MKAGINSSTYVREDCQLADNGGQVQVTVVDGDETIRSAPAFLSVNPRGTVYYVATNGSGANSGLTIDAPWDLPTGCWALTNDNTIIVLPGIYTAGAYVVRQGSGPATIISQVRWKAIICDSPAEGFRVDYPPVSSNLVIDGFCISNVANDGISFVAHDSRVRNCWIYNSGNGLISHDGINSSNIGNSNNIIENNLVEYVHAAANDGTGHGLYVAGPNNIVRNNLLRHNGGYGIHHYVGTGGSWANGNQDYNNLTYGHTNNWGEALWGADGHDGANPGTNSVFANTFLDGIQLYYGVVNVTNNIILPGAHFPDNGMYFFGPHAPIVFADYNLGTNTMGAAGPHDVITTYEEIGFVNPSAGLYWLTAASRARGMAFPEVYGPVDFFGNEQNGISDIGAFQYDARLAADTRILEPSPADPAYWRLP